MKTHIRNGASAIVILAALAFSGAPARAGGNAPTQASDGGASAGAGSFTAKDSSESKEAGEAKAEAQDDADHHHHHRVPTFDEFRQILEEEAAFDCNENIKITYQLHYPKCEHLVMVTGDAEQGKRCMEQARELADQKVLICEREKKESIRLLKLPVHELRKQYDDALRYVAEHPEIAADPDHHGHHQEAHP